VSTPPSDVVFKMKGKIMTTIKEVLEDIISTGVTKYRLAKNLGVEPIMIDRWINQKVKTMRTDCAMKLHDIYGKDIDILFISQRKNKRG